MTAQCRVLLVDDHPSTRTGLRLAIDAQPDLCTLAEAGTRKKAFDLAIALHPDVMVLDLNLPDGDGWTLLNQLKEAKALPPTLVLSVCDEQVYARRLLRAGASGYLMKEEPIERILQAIRDVSQGRFATSDTLTSQLIHEAIQRTDEPPPSENADALFSSLSDRELQIFALLGRGVRSKEIASHLNLNEKTVATYKVRVMLKVGVKTTPELIEKYKSWSQ